MNMAQATALALFNAMQSKTLAKPGGCKYTTARGNHCIVGEVLTQAGVRVPRYREEANTKSFDGVTNIALAKAAIKAGLDPSILSQAQSRWDKRAGSRRNGVRGMRDLIDHHAKGWYEPIPTPVLETA